MAKRAFLVIIDYTDEHNAPVIGDIGSAMSHAPWIDLLDWDVHATEATAKMLAHHGIPYPEEG